ncbi:MAG: hypothetical protein JW716_00150 [Candidatus Aenigmarchaeota archaeon]|nr:hypothetical protein [Candidatus Aenigmarchaeota archaeon]
MAHDLAKILNKAYKKGGINRREYEAGIKEIKRQRGIVNKKTITKVKTVRIAEKEIVLGEVKIIKDAKGPRVVFDTGKEQVPLNFDSDKVNFPASLFYDAIRMGNRYPGFGFSGMAPMMMPVQQEGPGVPINLKFSSSQPAQQTEPPEEFGDDESGDFGEEETMEEQPEPQKEEPPKQQIKPQPPAQQNIPEAPKAQTHEEEKKYQVEAEGPKQEPEQQQVQQNGQQIDINVPGKTFGQNVEFLGHKQEQPQVQNSIKEDVKLIDMKKEVPLKEKKEEKKKKKEEKKKDEDEGGFLKRFLKPQKKESRNAKLERIAKENLEKIKEISDSRTAIVKVAHVLKDFLEIKMEIQFSTTYGELIDILKEKKGIHPDIKKEIIGFFRKVNECEYARGFEGENFSDFYKSARRIIEEMSD